MKHACCNVGRSSGSVPAIVAPSPGATGCKDIEDNSDGLPMAIAATGESWAASKIIARLSGTRNDTRASFDARLKQSAEANASAGAWLTIAAAFHASTDMNGRYRTSFDKRLRSSRLLVDQFPLNNWYIVQVLDTLGKCVVSYSSNRHDATLLKLLLVVML